jgi:hypothetical protein
VTPPVKTSEIGPVINEIGLSLISQVQNFGFSSEGSILQSDARSYQTSGELKLGTIDLRIEPLRMGQQNLNVQGDSLNSLTPAAGTGACADQNGSKNCKGKN